MGQAKIEMAKIAKEKLDKVIIRGMRCSPIFGQ